MAEKRMFDKRFMGSDAFLELSPSSQMLPRIDKNRLDKISIDKNKQYSNFENLSDNLSDEIIENKSIKFYFETYQVYKRKPHPYLKADQLNHIRNELGCLIDEFCLSFDNIQDMIVHFFEYPPKGSNGNINLFVVRSIFIVLGYSTNTINGYTD